MRSHTGLSNKEAAVKLKKYGLNEIRDTSQTTPLKILIRQIKSNFLIYLLSVAVFFSFIVGKSITAYAILAVILMVVIIGFIQEYKAEKAIHALKGMLVANSMAVRDGKEKEIPSNQIVPGDILILRTGEKVPADCLLLEEQELKVNEAVLTGESGEVGKKISSNGKHKDENMLFMGTFVVNGRCLAKAVHTGMNTKFGQIAGLISSAEKDMPLQIKVNSIVKYMVTAAIIVSVMTGALIFWRAPIIDQEIIITTLILIIALSVSAFPEGFPVVLITTLAAGARRMAKQNAIVNRMSIIETLGETTVICSDKTGTITKGEMTINRIFANDEHYDVTGTGFTGRGDFLLNNKKIEPVKEPVLEKMLHAAVLCNDAIIERIGTDMEFKTSGSPTESALMVLGAKAGLFKEDVEHERIQEMPFNSTRKMMTVLCRLNRESIVFSKGAPEYILKHCAFVQKNGKILKLSDKEQKKILEANKNLNSSALRTIALAYKKVDDFDKNHFEENLIFLGLTGMEDPAREEVKDTLKQCRAAGIKVKMITGDNQETARSIAKEIGLRGGLIDGDELENMTDEELAKNINHISIFARVKPEHKLRLVNILKANGEIVTMTGDGVNDAPALKEAHIGIAMGKNGTDVSRSVADMTIKDDNFATIVGAVREGRNIFKNIRKFATYQLTCNFAELTILFFGVLLSPWLGWQIPLLLALQILFMNLVTDNLPAITLGLNPSSQDSMIDPPRRNSNILNKKLIILLVSTGSLLALMVLSVFYVSFNLLGESTEYARTAALFTLICLEVVSAFNFRSFRKGLLFRSPFINPYLFFASLISLAATFIIIYTPLNKVFETVPLGTEGFILALLMCVIFAVIFDSLKYLNRRLKIVNLETA